MSEESAAAGSETDVFADLTKLRVVRRHAELDEAYETTAVVYTSRPSLERPARGYLKGSLWSAL